MKIIIRNATIFDGGSTVYNNTSILFDETGILNIGKYDAAQHAADAIIDGTGKYVIPGLIDCHVHMSTGFGEGGAASSGAEAAFLAREVLNYGITTIRSCGNGHDADIEVRNLINKGYIKGARILASGKGICITGGHGWPMCFECDTEAEVLKAARTQLKKGADVIKLLATGGMGTKGSNPNAAQLTEGQMRAAVEEAETLGVLTAAHCTGLEGAKRAIRAGVRSIEHARLDRCTAELMKEYGAYYCPTIITRYNILNSTDPNLAWLRAKANPQDLVEKERAIRLCLELDIPVCASTDSGTGPLCPLGPSTAKELAIYVEYGMTPMEALRSANRTAAEMLRIEKETGTIEVGKSADLLLLSKNPLDDIKNLDTLICTYHKGVLAYQKYKEMQL